MKRLFFMKYTITVTDITSDEDGFFSVYTRIGYTGAYLLHESQISRSVITSGYVADVSDDVTEIRILNDSPCCFVHQTFDVKAYATRPISVTPTPSLTRTATPTPTRTPTPTKSENVGTTIPNWLYKIGASSNSGSRDYSLYVSSPNDIEVRVESVLGTPTSGLGWQGVPWNNTTWVPGTSDYAFEAGYTEVFRLNGTSPGVNGLLPGSTYKFYFRRASDPSTVYLREIAIPLYSQSIYVIYTSEVPVTPTPTPTRTAVVTPTPTRSQVVSPGVTPTPSQSSQPSQGNLQFSVYYSND